MTVGQLQLRHGTDADGNPLTVTEFPFSSSHVSTISILDMDDR